MSVPKSIVNGKGSWRGRSKLHLPWLEADARISESASRLHIDCDGQNASATIVYAWEHEGKAQEGTILLCGHGTSKDVELGWVDTWHQNSSVMHLVGRVGDDGSVSAKGAFKVEGQAWGWTIALAFEGERLRLKMENVTPLGIADWAVDALYSRD